MNALKKQLKNDIENYIIKDNKKIETVFIGGGTPSTIKAFEYKEIFEIIKPHLEKNAEITTEANPNSASFDWLKGMHDLGVNRVSFFTLSCLLIIYFYDICHLCFPTFLSYL